MRKILAFLLAVAVLLSFAACGTDPVPNETTPTTAPTTAPTTEPTTEPTTVPTTEPPPDPAQLYDWALNLLNSGTAFTLNVQTQRTLTVDQIQFTESSQQVLTYYEYGTEQFHAASSETVTIGEYVSSYEEQFREGGIYSTVNKQSHFKGAMTAEEYTSRYVPVALLDASLYGEMTYEGNVLTFRGPTAGESWIVPEYATLVDAVGTATLDESGCVDIYTYTVSYTVNGANIQYVITVDVDTTAEPVAEPDADIEYVELEFPDAPRFMEQAKAYLAYLGTNHSLSVNTVESLTTYAGGAIRNQSVTIESWGSQDNYMGKVNQSVFLLHAQGSDSYEQEELFLDDHYTVSVDGGKPKRQLGITADAFLDYSMALYADSVFSYQSVIGCTATDLGSVYLLELTLTDEKALEMKAELCSFFWGDEAFLDDLADDYRTAEITAYLSIDKNTGLPLAAGSYYEGYHTIYEEEFLLSVQRDQSFDLLSADAYESISEEPPVPAEPEEKATPLFYHVTGENGQEMWLLGTIHIGDARTSYLPQAIYDAFDAADALAVEYNSEAFDRKMEEDEEFANQVTDNYFYSDGTQTKDHVEDEELFGYAEMYMKATGNYGVNVPLLKVNAWANSIENFFVRQTYDLSSTQGVDNQLIWRAQQQEKEILDVESGLFQTQMLMGFSDGLQEQLLYEAVYSDPYEYADSIRELFEMWCSGNEAELIEYLTEEPDYTDWTDEEIRLMEEYNNAMGTDRNDDMHDVAVGYLESGDVVFYAVGLAHLLETDGLVNTLRDAGYTVELVTFE